MRFCFILYISISTLYKYINRYILGLDILYAVCLIIFCVCELLFGLWFYISVNSYGHVETVS